MRLITWNINGIRTLPQFYPWYQLKTYNAIFNELGGDIICVQETKITLDKIDKGMACMDHFDSFFSCYRRTPPKGYSGTAIFTKKSSLVPVLAEEGLSNALCPDPTSSDDNQLIGGYPSIDDTELATEQVRDLDLEGRTTIIDCKLFVLINVYCPNETNDTRLEFKNAFNEMLEARVRKLIELGRKVIVVGDINICAQPIDHADFSGTKSRSNNNTNNNLEEEDFFDHSSRKWFNQLIGPDGVLDDVCRKFHPTRERMYTCWNTKTDARASNYGTRIDYILVTRDLLPWISACDIQEKVRGSDHCPVYVDFHDSIIDANGEKYDLWKELNPHRSSPEEAVDPPKLAARFMDEFSGKQRLLSMFFQSKNNKGSSTNTKADTSSSDQKISSSRPTSTTDALQSRSNEPSIADARHMLSSMSGVNTQLTPQINSTLVDHSEGVAGDNGLQDPDSPHATKNMLDKNKSITKGKVGKTKVESSQTKLGKSSSSQGNAGKSSSQNQQQLNTFLGKRSTSNESSPVNNVISDDDECIVLNESSNNKRRKKILNNQSTGSDIVHEQNVNVINFNSTSTKTAWSDILCKKPIPKCNGHNEDAREWTVNKRGPNRGRKFWMCARGPGAKGDSNARCNFFKWDSEVKRPENNVAAVNGEEHSGNLQSTSQPL